MGGNLRTQLQAGQQRLRICSIPQARPLAQQLRGAWRALQEPPSRDKQINAETAEKFISPRMDADSRGSIHQSPGPFLWRGRPRPRQPLTSLPCSPGQQTAVETLLVNVSREM